MDKTKEIFNLMAAEAITDGVHGLSASTAALFAGNPAADAKSEAEFIQQVLGLCNCFTDFVNFLIYCQEGMESDSRESDLQVLSEMANWTFDADKVEALAREDWERRKYKVAVLTESPVISVNELSF